MHNFKKTSTSVIAGLLAVLTLSPSLTVSAANGVTGSLGDPSGAVLRGTTSSYDGKTDNSVIHWGTTLPKDGRYESYRNDDGWHRIVLEYGDYCTNSVDSSGNYTNLIANKTSSWPSVAWHNSKQPAEDDVDQPADWPGYVKTEWMKAGTLQRAEDHDIYANGEYSEDGMYSLWIKYAGTCTGGSNKGEDCWYISPCDENGDRTDRIWALDCCLDTALEDRKKSFFDEYFLNIRTDMADYVTGSKPVMMGIEPTFNLLTPTYDEFEGNARYVSGLGIQIAKVLGTEIDGFPIINFQKAGVAVSYYHRYSTNTWKLGGARNDYDANLQNVNTGKILCDYYDNEKWIIKEETDENGNSYWTVQSAGWIDWDWTNLNGDFAKLFWESPDKAMAYGLNLYTKAVTFAQVAGGAKRDGRVPYATQLLAYLGLWATDTWYSHRKYNPFWHFAYMVLLSDYAENVYIAGGFKHSGTTKFNGAITNQALSNGELTASYGMDFINTATLEQYNYWLDEDIKTTWDNWDFAWFYENMSAEWTYDRLGISVTKEVTSATGEATTVYKTIDEIKKCLLFHVEPNWAPTKGQGAFDALYVGDILETEHVQENGESITVDADTDMVMGTPYNYELGYCRGGVFLGTTVKQAVKQDTLSSYKAPSLTVAKGGSLQIDGPTYAAPGTTITVQGTMNVSPNAFLCSETITSVIPEAYRQGIHLIIDGGTVTVNSGSMLDVGFGSVEIKNGGTLYNSGVVIQATDSQTGEVRNTTLQGGTIENSESGWVVLGAEVKNGARLTMVRGVNYKTTLAQLATYISDVRDVALGKYLQQEAASELKKYAALRLDSTNSVNLLMNSGNMLVVGAIKGNTIDLDKVRSGGSIYRGWDIVRDSTISIRGADFTNHAGQSDSDLQEYYALTDIDYENASYIGDDEADTIVSQKNMMALRVGTGSQGTSGISNFRITYVDTFGAERTQVVDTASLQNTYELVTDFQFCGTSQKEKGDSHLKTHKTGGAMSESNMPTTLEPVSNVTYIFQTASPVSYVKTISFQGTGVGSWICTELNIYRLKYLFPLEEYGWSSEDWYVPFEGELIAETALGVEASGVRSTTFVWDSNLVVIGVPPESQSNTPSQQLNIYNAPDGVESQIDKTGFACFKASKEYKYYSTTMENYTFSTVLADTMSAGMESLYNVGTNVTFNKILSDADWQKKYEQDVTLDMQLTYVDTRGSAHRVTLPLSQSAVEWAYANMNSTSRAESIHGLFQQGEEIAFRAPLPDFSSLVEASLIYDDPGDGASIAVASVTVNKTDYTNVAVQDGVLSVSAPESAQYFYCAPDVKGTVLDAGRTLNLNLKEWDGTESLTPAAKGTKYLVIVETDSMTAAGTTKDLYVSFTYESVSGASFVTPQYALRGMVNDYYGYWLNSAGEDADCGYLAAVSPGGQMYFVLNLSNVYKFTSATFYMPGKGETVVSGQIVTETPTDPDTPTDIVAYAPAEGNDTEGGGQNTEAGAGTGEDNEVIEAADEFATLDSWQMKAITVYELDQMGERKVVMGSGVNLSGIVTNRTYYRENVFSTRGAVSRVKSALLVAPGQSKTVSFEGSVSGGSGLEDSENKATKATELRYEDTKRDFGFNTRRVMYSVAVQVKGTSITSVEDGDCGSKNQFYFQLVFQDEDGKLRTSPCVLANQQLNSDGFRTGTEENFCIYTNDDYGTPVQINIIPDDTSSTSDVFDKLCIDYITVSRTSGTGVNLSWKTGSVGWIDIEYTDDAEEKDGRTNEELIRSFQLQEDGYSVWLEFAIETDSTYYNSKQFVGQVVADITYRDTSGALQTKENVGVVGKIADYAERKSELADATEKNTEVSLPSFMFRRGYTNRFLQDFHDISSLVSIKFKLSSTEPASGLTIRSVSARQVYDRGTLTMNVFNEYQHIYSVEPQDLAATSNAKPLSIAATGTKNTGTLYFTSGNTITINLAEGEEEVEVETGESEGANDKISMTVELADTAGIAAGTAMTARVVYKDIYGDRCSVDANLLFDAESQKFMIPMNDLPKTADIGVPYQVEITGGTMAGKMLTAVKVNQLRDSGVEETFLFVPEAPMALLQAEPVTLVLSESEQDTYAARKGYTHENQEVYMKLGTLTERILLTETQDLQLALIYTEKDDPYPYEHTSDYVSVLDNGYTVLKSGNVVWVPMNVNNIGSVKAVNFKTSSTNMKINIDKACVFLQETSNLSGTMLSYGWVNLPAATGLIQTETGTNMNSDGTSLQDALKSATRITPIGVEANLSTIARSDAIMKVTVFYLNAGGTMTTKVFEKSAADWNKEGVWELIDGITGVSYYVIEVYDTDPANLASVTVGDMEISWFNSDGELTTASVTGSTVITEGGVVSNALVNSTITGTAVTSDGQTLKLEDNVVSAERTEYQTVNLTSGGNISISASMLGIPGELQMTVVNKATGENRFNGVISADATSESIFYAFNLPNYTLNDVTYEVNIYSKTFSDPYSVRFYIVSQAPARLETLFTLLGHTAVVPVNDRSVKMETITEWSGAKTYTYYFRPVNYSAGMDYTFTPVTMSNGTANSTLTVTENVTVDGFDGTWTRFVVTVTGDAVDASKQYFKLEIFLKGQPSSQNLPREIIYLYKKTKGSGSGDIVLDPIDFTL